MYESETNANNEELLPCFANKNMDEEMANTQYFKQKLCLLCKSAAVPTEHRKELAF